MRQIFKIKKLSLKRRGLIKTGVFKKQQKVQIYFDGASLQTENAPKTYRMKTYHPKYFKHRKCNLSDVILSEKSTKKFPLLKDIDIL